MSYEAVEVNPGQFAAATTWARAMGWRGANITIPFKIEAAAWSDTLTRQADAIGAVNVLKFDGKNITGHNTDADGLMDSLKFAGVVMSGKRVLVFGAGGAARAVGYTAAEGGALSVHFTNRTAAKAANCSRQLGSHFPETHFSSGAPKAADIWFNATPSAKAPSKSLCAPVAAVDLVYGKITPFQRHAKRLGAHTIDGTGMLVFQALRAYEFWNRPVGPRRRAELAALLIQELS